jgi:hypothetical protein
VLQAEHVAIAESHAESIRLEESATSTMASGRDAARLPATSERGEGGEIKSENGVAKKQNKKKTKKKQTNKHIRIGYQWHTYSCSCCLLAVHTHCSPKQRCQRQQ